MVITACIQETLCICQILFASLPVRAGAFPQKLTIPPSDLNQFVMNCVTHFFCCIVTDSPDSVNRVNPPGRTEC